MKKTPVEFTCTINPKHNEDLAKILTDRWDFQPDIFIYRSKEYVVLVIVNITASGIIGIAEKVISGSPYQKFEEDSYYVSSCYEELRQALNQDKPFTITLEEICDKVRLSIAIEGQEPVRKTTTRHTDTNFSKKCLFELFSNYSVFREECTFKIPYSFRDRYLYLEKNDDSSVNYALVKAREVELFIKTVEIPIVKKGVLKCEWTSVNMANTFKRICFDGDDLNILRDGTKEPIWIIQHPGKKDIWLAECKGWNYRAFLIQRNTNEDIFNAIFKQEEVACLK